MIDTVVLEVQIKNPITQKLIDIDTFDNWTPTLRQILNNSPITIPCEKSTLNPPKAKAQKLLNDYQPRLTVQKQMISGGFRWVLYIEFSVQKLLFGNNYLEVDNSDFWAICKKLETWLKSKGINMSALMIRHCTCRVVHYAKNCMCSHSVHDTILELHKADFRNNFNSRQSMKLDAYWGGGLGLDVYIQKRALAFYDKKAELAYSVNKGDQPTLKKQDLRKLQHKKILRVEFRLEDKAQIRKYLGTHGFIVDEEPKFYQVFGEAQAKELLRSELELIERNWFWDSSVRSVGGLRSFVRKNLAFKDTQEVLSVATTSMLANQYGATEARLILGSQWKKSKRQAKNLRSGIAKNPYLEEVIEEVTKFDLIKTIS